jgi:hypothetical protein
MKTVNPTVDDILSHYFHYQCTITFRNTTQKEGTFTPHIIRESHIIKGWHFTPINEKNIPIRHDQIAIIERLD